MLRNTTIEVKKTQMKKFEDTFEGELGLSENYKISKTMFNQNDDVVIGYRYRPVLLEKKLYIDNNVEIYKRTRINDSMDVEMLTIGDMKKNVLIYSEQEIPDLKNIQYQNDDGNNDYKCSIKIVEINYSQEKMNNITYINGYISDNSLIYKDAISLIRNPYCFLCDRITDNQKFISLSKDDPLNLNSMSQFYSLLYVNKKYICNSLDFISINYKGFDNVDKNTIYNQNIQYNDDMELYIYYINSLYAKKEKKGGFIFKPLINILSYLKTNDKIDKTDKIICNEGNYQSLADEVFAYQIKKYEEKNLENTCDSYIYIDYENLDLPSLVAQIPGLTFGIMHYKNYINCINEEDKKHKEKSEEILSLMEELKDKNKGLSGELNAIIKNINQKIKGILAAIEHRSRKIIEYNEFLTKCLNKKKKLEEKLEESRSEEIRNLVKNATIKSAELVILKYYTTDGNTLKYNNNNSISEKSKLLLTNIEAMEKIIKEDSKNITMTKTYEYIKLCDDIEKINMELSNEISDILYIDTNVYEILPTKYQNCIDHIYDILHEYSENIKKHINKRNETLTTLANIQQNLLSNIEQNPELYKLKAIKYLHHNNLLLIKI